METQELTLTCTKCGLEKPDKDFPKNRSKKLGRNTWCRICTNKWRSAPENRERIRASARKRARKNPKKLREQKRIRAYGVCDNIFGQLLIGQNMQCAICEKEIDFTTGHVDHCHEQGFVRGLLCMQCNMGLGQFMHSPDILHRAINYLEESLCQLGNQAMLTTNVTMPVRKPSVKERREIAHDVTLKRLAL